MPPSPARLSPRSSILARRCFAGPHPIRTLRSTRSFANSLLYYFTGSITSSFWLYYLRSSGPAGDFQRLEDTVVRQPVGFGCGAYEIHWVSGNCSLVMPAADCLSWNSLRERASSSSCQMSGNGMCSKRAVISSVRTGELREVDVDSAHIRFALALESPETLARDMNKMFQTNEVRKSLGIES